MTAHIQITDPSNLASVGTRRGATAPADEVPVCCGKPMQPHFAHARDRYGNEFFVTVWRCLHCGKLVH